MHEWRKKRDGKTGSAIKGGCSRESETAYEESEKLRYLEFLIAKHPKERFFDREIEVREIDAVRPHRAIGESARAIVVPASEGQPDVRHRLAFTRLPDRCQACERVRLSRLP
jgi:hypothetical protein